MTQLLSTIANIAQIISTFWGLCFGGLTLFQIIQRIHAWWVADRSQRQLLLPTSATSAVPAGSVGTHAAASDTAQLQATLCAIFDFTPDDLEQNRHGRVSESQRKRLKKKAIFAFEVYVFVVLAVFVTLSFVVPVVFVSGMFMIALLLIALDVRYLRRILSTIKRGPTVAKDVGPIKEQVIAQTDGGLAATTGYSYSYSVRGVSLPTGYRQLRLPDLTYHVFSATDAGLDKKFLSIEPCLETPTCTSVVILRTRD